MLDRADELRDTEFVYRRISDQNYNIGDPFPAQVAFRPNNKDDTNGLSFRRAKYVPLHKAAISPRQPSKHFYVARLRLGDLRREGMQLEIDAKDRKHVFIVNLNYSNRRERQQSEWQVKMAQELCTVHDPSKIRGWAKALDTILCWFRQQFC